MILPSDIPDLDIKNWWLGSKPETIPPPSILQIEVTKNCNLKCVFCHKGQCDEFVRTDISDIVIQQVATIFPYIKLAMLFGDGEPLLYKGFWDLVSAIRKESPLCAIEFITNGTTLTKDNVNKCLEYKISNIGVSLAGATSETHNKLRIKSDLEQIKSNLMYLKKRKEESNTLEPYVSTLFTVMQSNYTELPDFIKWCQYTGCYSVGTQSLIVTHPTMNNEIVSDEELQPYINKAKEVARLGNTIFRGEGKSRYNPKDIHFLEKDHFHINEGYCSAEQPWNTVYVLYDGTVVPDCHWWTSVRETELNICGKLDEQNNILDIWYGNTYDKIRSRIKNVQILPQCRGCGLAGGVKKYLRCDDTDHTDPSYELTQMRHLIEDDIKHRRAANTLYSSVEICTGFKASTQNSIAFKSLEVFLKCYIGLGALITIYDASLDIRLLDNFMDNKQYYGVRIIKFQQSLEKGSEHLTWDFAIRNAIRPYIFVSHLDCFPTNVNALDKYVDTIVKKDPISNAEIVLVGHQDIHSSDDYKLSLPRISPVIAMINVQKWNSFALSWSNTKLLSKNPEMSILETYIYDVGAFLGPYLKQIGHYVRLLESDFVDKNFKHFWSISRDTVLRNRGDIHLNYIQDNMKEFEVFYHNIINATCEDYTKEHNDLKFGFYEKVLSYCVDHNINLQQDAFEFDRVLYYCSLINPHRICEIGSAFGGSLYGMSTLLKSGDIIISIDFTSEDLYEKKKECKLNIAEEIRSRNIQSYLIESRSQEAEKLLVDVLGQDKLDVLLIDGDHNNPKKDFDMYKKYVRNGGIIILHDSLNDNGGVPKYILYDLGYNNVATLCGDSLNISSSIGTSFLYKKDIVDGL